MTCYLSSPQNQMQAHAASGQPVLISFANFADWHRHYLPSFGRLLIDSGAYSELTGRARIDLGAYVEFAAAHGWADAWAGLDDISGDWKRSLKNYEAGGFPTIHEADPIELLDDLIPMARERGKWIGLGLTPPRHGKESTVRRILERIPDDLHVHGWACQSYAHLPRFDSFDSTNWFRDSWALRSRGIPLDWLTPAECLEIVVKRYQRAERMVETTADSQAEIFGTEAA
jgi:hypothetical protein